MMVGNLCKTDVVTISSAATVCDAARLMLEQHVGLLVVVTTGSPPTDLMPVGVLTDRDIVIAVVAKNADAHTLEVGDVMTRSPLLVAEEHTLEGTLRHMREAGVRRVPVIGARGQLTGILSFDDIIDAFASQLSDVAAALRSERNRERVTRS